MLKAIYSALSGDGIGIDFIIEICALAFVSLCCFPVHESAHAWMADKLGDPTGRLKGRISLNPFVHLDLIGTVMILLFGFGYAKPVPVNIRNFEKRKLYFGLTALAGPVSNLILAIVSAIIEQAVILIAVRGGFMSGDVQMGGAATVIYVSVRFFQYACYINVALAVFNLIPVPPLDGSRLLTAVLPDRIYYKVMQYERISMYVLFGLIFLLNRLDISPVSYISELVYSGIQTVVALPFEVLM